MSLDSHIECKPAFVFASLGPHYPLLCYASTEEKCNKKCPKNGAEQKVPCFCRYGLVFAESREMKAIAVLRGFFGNALEMHVCMPCEMEFSVKNKKLQKLNSFIYPYSIE